MPEFALAPVGHGGADWSQARPVSCPALTPIQIKILSFIQKYQQLWGATPRYGEIALDCGLGSDSAVGYQIRRLAKLGIVHKPARLHRAIRLIVIPVAGPG